jgi:pyruvate kinase
MTHTQTKIICTIGPSVDSLEKICELIDAGMNGARLNFSHGDYKEHARVISLIKKARDLKKAPLAIILDTKGPEIRIASAPGDALTVSKGDIIFLCKKARKGGVVINPGNVIDDIPKGAMVLINDGYITTKVIKKEKDHIVVEVQNNGVIRTKKGVNIPGVDVSLPAMTPQDIKDITFGCEHDVDLIAASFIRSAEHVKQIRALLEKLKKPDILIYSKIENSLGVKNFDEIIKVSDGIMVARGDLGVELPLPQVPPLQKKMIRSSLHAMKPVVTATQMLESMIGNPRPTRAEVSDVANAIYDSSSSIMLSGETAVGAYPIETVVMMKNIAKHAEKDFNYREFFERESHADHDDVSSSVAIASVKTAYSADAKAIFAITSSGSTARQLSRFRPSIPIIALTESPKVYHQLALVWGIVPMPPEKVKDVESAVRHLSAFALEKGFIKKGSKVVITSGTPFGVKGTTNNMSVRVIDAKKKSPLS